MIFVDDLDRLSAEEMISGLDAVRSFMEIPQDARNNGMGVVFVISCDEDRVADALYAKRHKQSMPAAVIEKVDARRFLDRLFQFRLEIPQFPKRDMRSFVLNKLQNEMKPISESLHERNVGLDVLVDRMIHVGVQSPRNALQILNAFAQSWWIAIQRERAGAGSTLPGGLGEGAVTKHPLCLAVLCALRVDFPDFYGHLQQEPDLIRRFSAVYVHGGDLDDQPESTRTLLAAYADEAGELKPAHRPLRRFLASVESVRLPVSLQPLLLLSQDPVTRGFGDRAAAVYQSFVSGDVAGVLAELGREKDQKPLSSEDVSLLRGLEEELHHETGTRRDSAAFVISSLAERLPNDQRHHLLVPLARRLTESPELRWRLGIDRIRAVIASTGSEDQRFVASCLIEDLLKEDSDIDFRLPKGEAPSLDEALEMARDACSLVLDVYSQHGLGEHAGDELLRWLQHRRVGIGGQSQELPFAQLDSWVSKHEDVLLPALSDAYCEMAAAYLEAATTDELDIAELLRRSERVFQDLWNSGEESRAILWQLLDRYLAVRQTAAVRVGWSWIEKHKSAPDAKQISALVTTLATRLQSAIDDEGDWSDELHKGGDALLQIVSHRIPDLSPAALQQLQALCLRWSKLDDSAQYASRLVTSLKDANDDTAASIASDWGSRLLDNLPGPCAEAGWRTTSRKWNLDRTSKLSRRYRRNCRGRRPMKGTRNAPGSSCIA